MKRAVGEMREVESRDAHIIAAPLVAMLIIEGGSWIGTSGTLRKAAP
jgi:hypothetical protein